MNKIMTLPTLGSAALMLALLGACSQQEASPGTALADTPAPQAAAETRPEPAPVVCVTCGVVRSITAVSQQGEGTGVGAALGAIAGGVAGNQVGGGSGRKIATVVGVVGGAVLGNNIEKNRNSATYYEITIDMESGGQQIITVPDASGVAVGSAVSVQGDTIQLR